MCNLNFFFLSLCEFQTEACGGLFCYASPPSLNCISSTLWQALIIDNRNEAGTGMSPGAAQTNSRGWWAVKCSVSTLGFVRRKSGLSFIFKAHRQTITFFSFFMFSLWPSNHLTISLQSPPDCFFFFPLSDDIDGVPQRWGTGCDWGTHHPWDDVPGCRRVL